MPKIIENLQNTILREARSILLSDGAEALTVVAVARRCGIAVGTIYNYYPSKDKLIAEAIVADWEEALAQLDRRLVRCAELRDVLRELYTSIDAFSRRYKSVIACENSLKISGLFTRAMRLNIRHQLAGRVSAQRSRFGYAPDAMLEEFLAEAMMTWAVREPDYSRMEPVFLRLL